MPLGTVLFGLFVKEFNKQAKLFYAKQNRPQRPDYSILITLIIRPHLSPSRRAE